MRVRDTNTDDCELDISSSALERELNVKLELASLERYDKHVSRVLKGDPELLIILKNSDGISL